MTVREGGTVIQRDTFSFFYFFMLDPDCVIETWDRKVYILRTIKVFSCKVFQYGLVNCLYWISKTSKQRNPWNRSRPSKRHVTLELVV